ncbi:MAG: MBL fold metallo-hydrolase [Bdellovibrionota bacterium]
MMKLSFLGAAGTVTGSKFLLQTGDSNILVDCGLFQGFKQFRQMNRDDALIDVQSLDAVVLTHAHLDHSGYLPRLYKLGYRGPVFCSQGTKSLCSILLPDAGFIQEEDAHYANRKGISRHRPALPLYTEQDAKSSLDLLEPITWHEKKQFRDLTITLSPMGHIVGASSVYLTHQEQSILFSGDIGRQNDLLLHPPTPAMDANWIVMESTYGNRLHNKQDPLMQLADCISPTLNHGGVVLIPFSLLAARRRWCMLLLN